MKWFCFLLFLLSLHLIIEAQDTIVKRNGDKIITKLVEVNPHDVRYKRFDYLEGPLFRIQNGDIKYIVYGNGIKDSFENYVAPPFLKENYPSQDLSIQTSGIFYYYKERRIVERDMLAVVKKMNDPKLNLMIKKVEEKKFIQRTTMIAAIPLFFTGVYMYAANRPTKRRSSISSPSRINAQQNGEYLMLGALACDVVSIYFIFDRKRHDHILVNAYNKNLLSIR